MAAASRDVAQGHDLNQGIATWESLYRREVAPRVRLR